MKRAKTGQREKEEREERENVNTQVDTLPQLVQLGGQDDVTKLPFKAPRTCVPHKTSDPPSRRTAICRTMRARQSSHPLTSASTEMVVLVELLQLMGHSPSPFS